jgi:crotonobetainyl-CoA:carnitine CoA-transferase CaiB-like acyl-CoA transferase
MPSEPAVSPSALDDVVVLEFATGVAGPYCGKLLADLGARVIKVELPAGDPLRGEPPLVNGESAFFNYLNANKLGVQAVHGSPDLDRLLRRADVIIHSLHGPAAAEFEAHAAALAPHGAILSVTPYGRSGDKADWLATPFTEWATSGFFYFAGDPAREPLSIPGFQAEFHAGLHAAIGALVALWHARETGQGQCVEISHQEACLSDHAWLTTMWTHAGHVQKRTGSLYARCSDGWVYMFNLAAYPDLFVLMERFDLLEDESFFLPRNWAARFMEVFDAFGGWCANRTKQEVYHACQELRIAVSPVNTMADVAASEQLAARDWFGTVDAGGRTFVAPGFPYRLTATPCATRHAAPRLGEHTATVLSPTYPWPTAPTPEPQLAPRTSELPPRNSQLAPRHPGPLSGLRLIEMTANWAGPIAGRHFGDLGADVVKVELQTKPATRALIYPVDDVWPDFFHRSGYFNKLNRNKRGIALDLSKPRGREVFLELVRNADAVLENNAARVMANLGLDYAALAEANPRIIMCSMSGYGSSGPERNYSAYGSNIETASGLASLLGYDDSHFFGTGSFYADPVTGNHGTVAMLAALHARRRTGRGQWIDMALLEAVEPFLSQHFLQYTVTGEVPVPAGSQWGHGWVLQGVYPTAGNDCWLAVTCRDQADLDRLAAMTGAPTRDALCEWLKTRNHLTAAEELQRAGIPAAPVMMNWELVTDNHLNDRGYFVPVRHRVAGTHTFPGHPWRFEKTPASVRTAAPTFGEHNATVFTGVAGLSQPEVAALYELGITGDHPIYAAGPAL